MGNKLLEMVYVVFQSRYAVKITSVKSLDRNGRCCYGQNMVPSLKLIMSICRVVEGDFMFQRDKMLVVLLNVPG